MTTVNSYRSRRAIDRERVYGTDEVHILFSE